MLAAAVIRANLQSRMNSIARTILSDRIDLHRRRLLIASSFGNVGWWIGGRHGRAAG